MLRGICCFLLLTMIWWEYCVFVYVWFILLKLLLLTQFTFMSNCLWHLLVKSFACMNCELLFIVVFFCYNVVGLKAFCIIWQYLCVCVYVRLFAYLYVCMFVWVNFHKFLMLPCGSRLGTYMSGNMIVAIVAFATVFCALVCSFVCRCRSMYWSFCYINMTCILIGNLHLIGSKFSKLIESEFCCSLSKFYFKKYNLVLYSFLLFHIW